MAKDDSRKMHWMMWSKDFPYQYKLKALANLKAKGRGLNGKEMFAIAMYIMSESIPNKGELRFSKDKPYDIEMLSNVVGFPENEVRTTVETLTKLEILRTLDDGTMYFECVAENFGETTKGAERKRKERGYRKSVGDKCPQMSPECPPVVPEMSPKCPHTRASRDSIQYNSLQLIKEKEEVQEEVQEEFVSSVPDDIGKDDPNLGQSSFAKPETERVRQPITRDELHAKIETMNKSLADKVTPSEENDFWDWLVMNEFKVNRSGKKVTLTASTAVGVTLTMWRRFRKLEREKSDSERREKHGDAIGQRMNMEDCRKSLESFTEFSWQKT